MKISEIKEKLESGNKLEDIIKVRQYISFIEKKILIEKIVDSCLEIKDGILTVDQFNKRLVFDISILSNYVDIEFSDEFIQEYDYLAENKVVKFVEENMDSDERYFLNDMVYEMIENKLKENNSIEAIVGKNLKNLIDKLPSDKDLTKLIKTASKEFQKFDPQKMTQIQEMMKVVNYQLP